MNVSLEINAGVVAFDIGLLEMYKINPNISFRLSLEIEIQVITYNSILKIHLRFVIEK